MQGIYIIKNITNNKVYIGQSKNIKNRLTTHKRLWKKKTSKLYDAIYKEGIDNFTFEILEELNDSDDLLTREKYWKDEYNSVENGYNAYNGLETNDNLWNFAKKSKRKSDIKRELTPVREKNKEYKKEMLSYNLELKEYYIKHKKYRLAKLHNEIDLVVPKKPTKPNEYTDKVINGIKSVIVHYPPREEANGIDKEIVYVARCK